jgi:hypothetical protein
MNLLSIHDSDTPDDETLTARMRHQRDRLLAESDWTQTADAPVDKDAWATYRQALRDFPKGWVAGPTADFPEPPVSASGFSSQDGV